MKINALKTISLEEENEISMISHEKFALPYNLAHGDIIRNMTDITNQQMKSLSC